MKATLAISLVCVAGAAWGWQPTPSHGPKPPPPTAEAQPQQPATPVASEADLRARVEALEQRVAQMEKQLAALQSRASESATPKPEARKSSHGPAGPG